MKRLCVFLACIVFVGVNLLQAQTVQITGTVTSAEDKMPVPGASVSVKGTSIGVATDFDGKFTVSVPQSATTLIFSFIGMIPQEIVIAGRTVINVVLETDALTLEEIVITGLGVATDKRKVAISVESVSSDQLTKAPSNSIDGALIGRIAGAQIQSTSGQPGQ
jgi:TonB-dependent starch-binding outer membrane protein SusC